MLSTKFSRLLLLIVLLLLILGTLFASYYRARDTRVRAAGETITFTPVAIPITDPEIVNPLRGGYPAFGLMRPTDWPTTDKYDRYEWVDFEPTKDNYNYALIERNLAAAAAKGGRWGFRIQAASSSRGPTPSVPQYLVDLMPKGFWFTYPGNSSQTYAPDWNDPDFLSRAEALLQAIAGRFGNDPRLGWVEIGFYGDWSEWHIWQYPYSNSPYGPSPTGASDMTTENKNRIIDMHINAFPNKQVYMMFDEAGSILYALPKSTTVGPIGWRRDCLGYSSFINQFQQPYWPQVQDRWKVAPIIVETCYMNSGGNSYKLSLDQVNQYHISMVSGHNMSTTMTTQERADITMAYKRAGYRYVLNSLILPSVLTKNVPQTITTQWTNTNVAPIYEPWDVMMQLRNPANGAIVWQGKSQTNLKTILPSTTPTTITDTFSIPSTVVNGTYNVVIQVIDPKNYLKPLSLAIQGRATDGSYTLGQITVSGNISPTTLPSPTSPTSPTPASSIGAFTVYLHGIGKGGDTVTPGSLGNTSPLRPTRELKIRLFNASNSLVKEISSTLLYNTTNAYFTSSATLSGVAAGQYTMKLYTPQFLVRTVPGIFTFTPGTNFTVPAQYLVTGDINNDNRLDILDYNRLIDCYSVLGPSRNCSDTQQKTMADINDDGSVNQLDYNLFLRELSVLSGE